MICQWYIMMICHWLNISQQFSKSHCDLLAPAAIFVSCQSDSFPFHQFDAHRQSLPTIWIQLDNLAIDRYERSHKFMFGFQIQPNMKKTVIVKVARKSKTYSNPMSHGKAQNSYWREWKRPNQSRLYNSPSSSKNIKFHQGNSQYFSFSPYRKLVIVLGWLCLALLAYKVSQFDYEYANFDPYEILGVPMVCCPKFK